MPYNRSAMGGGYYGDPFLGGVLKGIGKVAKGAIGGFLGGGPIGAIGGAIGATGILGGGARPVRIPNLPISRSLPPVTGIHGQIGFPGGPQIAGGMQFGPRLPAAPQAAAPGQMIPKGYRWNKSGYFTRDGVFHPPGTKLVRIRRMNPANGRAVSRSARRLQSFANLAKRTRKAVNEAGRAMK